MSLFSRGKNPRVRRVRSLAARDTARARIPTLPLLLGLLLWVSALLLLNLAADRPFTGLTLGQRAPATVIARVDFKAEDIARTELNRQQAAAAVPPFFSIDQAPLNGIFRTLDKLVERVESVRRLAPPETGAPERALEGVLDLLGLPLTPEEVLALLPPGMEEEARQALKKNLRDVWMQGLISPEEKETAFQGLAAAGAIGLHAPGDVFRSPVPLPELLLPEAALQAVLQRMPSRIGEHPLPREALSNLLRPWLVPNLVYDQKTTAERRKAATQTVEPVIIRVLAGTTLVETGAPVTPQVLENLKAHDQRRRQLESPYDRLLKQIGNAGLLLGALMACAGILHVFAPADRLQPRSLLLMMVLSWLALAPTRLLTNLATGPFFPTPLLVDVVLPLALAPLLAVILLGPAAAVAVGAWNSFVLAILFEHRFSLFILGLLVTVVATLSARDVRKRARIYRAGALIGLTEIFMVISWAAIQGMPVSAVLIHSGVGFAGGLICALLAILLIPLFELVFRLTTNLTLLELCDLSHPLLQRLAMEAPGTYHHSIVVANLAQAAAQRIGANTLLVRAAAYFHDIGKLAKPEFFIENMRPGENPHDTLSPQMSTLIITSHVKEGLGLARRYRLPRVVTNGIEQHHGSGLVSFFYHRARQQQDAGTNGGDRAAGPTMPDADFRYDSPPPKTREMAILSLADAVEAAARALEKPTPARIEGLVHDITEAKLHDGQLDHCPLTLAELAKIKQSFVFTLASMMHVRIAYPPDETKPVQPAKAGPADDRAPAQTNPKPGEPDRA